MNRKVLLVEPNYKNKYPPMGLMKLASYFRNKGDDVRFFKGNMRYFAATLICEDLIDCLEICFPNDDKLYWKKHYTILYNFIRLGRYSILEHYEYLKHPEILDILKDYRRKYKEEDYFGHPRFDIVGITTLFTFYWDITIETINFAKRLCKDQTKVMVGGIAASILPSEIKKETGIAPFQGVLDKTGIIDKNDNTVIDELPLDYSILEEIDYEYPAHDAYFAYTTRGCINKCPFCAVPKLEPDYRNYISLRKNIETTIKRFGPQKDLLLLDNNVLASSEYEKIIDEIKKCGFAAGQKYFGRNDYDIAVKNLKDSYNDRAYLRKIVKIYKEIISLLKDEAEKQKFISLVDQKCLSDFHTASKEAIFSIDKTARQLYLMTHNPVSKKRIVDFNQGIDSRLVNDSNMKKLSETGIFPLRIAFDHWKLKDIYENAIRVAVRNGITKLSNYLLYNFKDKPEELYLRMRLNVDLCEELNASIYSFPMKYHPVSDPEHFKDRNYLGKHWNRKFIRAVQAVLNSTKGKIGRGKEFFEEAFGKDIEEFIKIMWMPETFIIYRRIYDKRLRERLSIKYSSMTENDCDLANEWQDKFFSLPDEKLIRAKEIISKNIFTEDSLHTGDSAIDAVLEFYRHNRNEIL